MRRALRFCSTPNCGALVESGKCDPCRRALEARRGTAHQRGYTVEWARYSRHWLRTHRWCGERADFALHADHSRCVQQGLRTRATVTDHIVSMRHGGVSFDPANHQSLCTACNTRKAIALEGALSVV